jgi:hypothetical protein
MDGKVVVDREIFLSERGYSSRKARRLALFGIVGDHHASLFSQFR